MWNRKARHTDSQIADNVSVRFEVVFIVCALIEFLIYDDGCHLKRYATHPERRNKTRLHNKLPLST